MGFRGSFRRPCPAFGRLPVVIKVEMPIRTKGVRGSFAGAGQRVLPLAAQAAYCDLVSRCGVGSSVAVPFEIGAVPHLEHEEVPELLAVILFAIQMLRQQTTDSLGVEQPLFCNAFGI